MRKITITIAQKICFKCRTCGLVIEASNIKEAADIHDRNRPHYAKLKEIKNKGGENFQLNTD